ncbi:MAG: endopeptidase La [Clostridiaceae bacterium]|jgi:ATP-dependent Lon protease|nr:endopeptidase La [Clostridiaceae bacterium]
MNTEKNLTNYIPLLPLRGLVIFPYMIPYFDVGREMSIKALEDAMVNDQHILLVAQKDASIESPTKDDIYDVGCYSKIKQLLKLPDGTIRVLVEGISRVKIVKITQTDPYFIAQYEVLEDVDVEMNEEVEALRRSLIKNFEEVVKLSGKMSPESVVSVLEAKEMGRLTDMISAAIYMKVEEKQAFLAERDVYKRMNMLIKHLTKEVEILEIEKDINRRVKQQMERSQREYYLREQIKVISDELGESDSTVAECDEYVERLLDLNFEEAEFERILKEINRLRKMQSMSPEATVIRTYLEWIFDLPWNKETKDRLDIHIAENILNEDHYGLEQVKERIIEFLAVKSLKKEGKSPVLCLVGPPGVGKTSIAKSIARAMNRKYVRMSLGGVRDEAEIRGHRRTYIGAMPGRIIKAVKQAESKNALILLDEIDKLAGDFRGDPAAALLEVLDTEQNYAFRDHYLEVPFDLSKIMFITTANTLDTIPRPLLDRMEVIRIPGYTDIEKMNIAVKYLIPKQLKLHGLNKSKLRIKDEAVDLIIKYYTREAGVRNLEREIASLCRKAAKYLVTGNKKSLTISLKNAEEFLGPKKYRVDKTLKDSLVGVARGLAWTSVGGDTLLIEVNIMPGTGRIELTGNLGEVMKESAKIAISYIRTKSNEYGIDPDFYKNSDIHVHVPEGAVPKDGPSAGITLCTAIVSALTGIKVKSNVAMTGELTLRGNVLPIGGLKEKTMAAHRAGVDTVIIPEENVPDLHDISAYIKEHLKFVSVRTMDEVLKIALVSMPIAKADLHNKITENNTANNEYALPAVNKDMPSPKPNMIGQ